MQQSPQQASHTIDSLNLKNIGCFEIIDSWLYDLSLDSYKVDSLSGETDSVYEIYKLMIFSKEIHDDPELLNTHVYMDVFINHKQVDIINIQPLTSPRIFNARDNVAFPLINRPELGDLNVQRCTYKEDEEDDSTYERLYTIQYKYHIHLDSKIISEPEPSMLLYQLTVNCDGFSYGNSINKTYIKMYWKLTGITNKHY